MTFKSITDITRDDVERAYSGAPGCACGCRGTYTTNKGGITRILNALKAIADADPDAVKVDDFGSDGVCYNVCGDTRYRWVYVPRDIALAK